MNVMHSKPKPGEEIVVTGMSGKFPDSNDVYHFRDNLYNKIDLVSGDTRRWKPVNPEIPQRTGKLFGIEKFDAHFFGVPERHAHFMDPGARMLLERVYEALLDAGHHPFDLEGTNTGVYFGIGLSETELASYRAVVSGSGAATGCQYSMMAKRISYFFKLNGPVFKCDTSCSSTLSALEHAYKHLREGRCEKAVVCGAHLCLHPNTSLQFARMGVLGPDGCCKSFDDAANGYARAEAVAVIVLEKLNVAKRVYAELVHTKTNCDGFKQRGIYFPSSEMQGNLMREFYEECEVDPTTLVYLEAHATGTKVGDAEELAAVDEVFCKGRKKPLHVGSVKSHIGHTEPVSAICSIVKVLSGFESGYIPPNIRFFTPKRGVEPLETGRLVVVTEKTPWPVGESGLVAVNSFGFGGTNGHVLLRWNPKVKTTDRKPADDLPRLVCVSGRSESMVISIFDHASKMDAEYIKLIHQIFRKVIPNQLYNGYVITSKLQGEVERVVCENKTIGNKLRVVFEDVDQDWFWLAGKLMEVPVFGEALQRIYEVLKGEFDLNILEMLRCRAGNSISGILGTVVVQLALGDVIKELRLDTYEIIGIGHGKLAAAYLNGDLSLNEVLFITYYISSGEITEINERAFRAEKSFSGKHPNFQAHGSLKYFIKNLHEPTIIKDGPRDINVISLIIGRRIGNLTEKDVSLIGSYSSEPIVELLRSLGRLFLLGITSHLDVLYPNIAYPVSRGTPMVSPLVKWNHSKDYNVRTFESETRSYSEGYKDVKVSLDSEEWSFLRGHVGDGRILFPASGYLVLAWECIAATLGKPMLDVGIVFEDVKYMRATSIPTKGTVTLKVVTQLEARRFEVIENRTLLITGTVYVLDEDYHKAETSSMVPNDDDDVTMNERDVRMEMGIRGYQYSSDFLSIKEFNPKRNRAVLSWNGNWIMFMDNMFHVQILSEDTRNLYITTTIKRVVIDAPRHTQHALSLNNEIPVIFHEDLETISGGGIEITGLELTAVPKKRTLDPILETCKFIPYHGRLKHSIAVRCMVQTVWENAIWNNSSTVRIKSVEILGTDEDDESLTPLIQQTLNDLTFTRSELKVLTKRRNFNPPGVQVENKDLTADSECTLLVAKGILQKPEILPTALRVIKNMSGFIITQQAKGTPIEVPSQVQLVSSYETEQGNILLLKESSKYIKRVPINISSIDDLSWVERLQSLTNEDILLYSQNPINGILGLMKCLQKEPTKNNISAMFIMDDVPHFDTEDVFFKSQLEKDLTINVFKNGTWGSYRFLLLPDAKTVDVEHCYVNAAMRGDLSSLKWTEGWLSGKTVQEQKKQLVHVHYSAINLKDVLTASGKLPPDVTRKNTISQERLLGFEFSGTLASDPSKRVMGMGVNGALSTLVMADPTMLYKFPDDWSLEEAATVPLVYSTVLYAFLMRGRMKRGQSVLIHSGTGGIGQAAINLASHLGCTIFTTVASKEKRDFIKKHYPKIKDEHIGDSRSTSFEQMIFEQTGGKGVDFVLNSLVGEKLVASLKCLAYNGTFLEIGKVDQTGENQITSTLLRKQARFEGIMLDHLLIGTDERKKTITKLMEEGIANGSIKPLIRTVFSSGDVEKAFRFVEGGSHIGKVLVKVRCEDLEGRPQLFKGIPRFSCDPTSSYVLVGGLGGFGLELADWLVSRGAKKLVLCSRTGIKNSYQSRRLNVFKRFGVRVSIRNDDVGSVDGCAALLAFAKGLGKVEGVFNLAVDLSDALFENQSVESFKISLKPKAYATRHLDVVSRRICPNLRYFVVFSSVVSGKGSSGQTNYGMANSVMERVCEKRKIDGYPALAIQWGAIGDVGLIVNTQDNYKELVVAGTHQQKISNCLHKLDQLLKQDDPIVASTIVAQPKDESGSDLNAFDTVLRIIGVTNLKTVSLHADFPKLGVDSMIATEIQQTLEREFGITVTAQDVRSMTLSKLKEIIDS